MLTTQNLGKILGNCVFSLSQVKHKIAAYTFTFTMMTNFGFRLLRPFLTRQFIIQKKSVYVFFFFFKVGICFLCNT